MPTGVEEAGLVMAAFPLIVCLIDEYREGLGTFYQIYARMHIS